MITKGKRQKGFTITELIISSGLFVVLISLASGAFIQSLRTQRIVTNLSASMNDVAFVTEQISREIRTGFGFTSGGDSLSFTNARGESVTYSADGSKIRRREGAGEWKNLTGDGVNIDNLEFILQGESSGDGEPPRITILMSVLGEKEIRVNLQTTVSSRILDT